MYLFSDVNEADTEEKSDAPSQYHEQLIKTYDSVYLLKWLCPPQELLSDHLILGGTKRFPLFHQEFAIAPNTYWDNFDCDEIAEVSEPT